MLRVRWDSYRDRLIQLGGKRMAQLQRADLTISDSQLTVRKQDKLKMRKVVCYWVKNGPLMLCLEWKQLRLSLVGREPVKAGINELMMVLIMTNYNGYYAQPLLASIVYAADTYVVYCHALTMNSWHLQIIVHDTSTKDTTRSWPTSHVVSPPRPLTFTQYRRSR